MNRCEKLKIINDISNEKDLKVLIEIFEILTDKIKIDTFTGMSKSEKRDRSSIYRSNEYLKIEVGSSTMVIKRFNRKDKLKY